MIRHIHRLPRRNVARLYCPALLVTSLKRPVLARRAHVSATLLHVRPPGLGRTIDIRRGFCAGHVGESVCWKCGQQARDGSLFCRDAGCGSILDPDNSKDMDYFELLGIEKRYDVDLREMEKLFWKLQMSLHPDKFQTASTIEKEYSETVSTRVNDAYATLKSPLSRAEYMLALAGKDSLAEDADAPKVNEAFLFEMMEAREEIEMTSDVDTLQELKSKYEAKVGALVRNDLEQAFRDNKIDAAFDLTVTLRYLTRIVEELREKLANS